MLLEYDERYGPAFSFRSLHRPIVAMLGPEANHFVTVSGADRFSWRKGMFGEQLIPLIGDGLITTDDAYHDRARRIMMPAFHRRWMDAAIAVMTAEASRAVAGWRPGRRLDVYEHVRDLAMAIAMRALLGLDPRSGGIGHDAALHFERAPAFYDTESWMVLLRGPLTPWARLQSQRRALDPIIVAEIERRRAAPLRERDDVLSMLIEARDDPDDPGATGSGAAGCRAGGEPGEGGFTSAELRDQVMHLLFGGHDTTSSTLSFLFYELARHPAVRARVTDELDTALGGRPPTAADLLDGLPYLSMVLDETAAALPAGVVRAAADRPPGGVRRPPDPRRRTRDPLRLGLAPATRGVARPRRVHPRALPPRAPARAAPGGLHPVRGRPPDLHRQALRAANGQGHRRHRAEPRRARAPAPLRAQDRQGPDAQPGGRAADAGRGPPERGGARYGLI